MLRSAKSDRFLVFLPIGNRKIARKGERRFISGSFRCRYNAKHDSEEIRSRNRV